MPRNGSCDNMAEMELSILTRQCLNRRFDGSNHMGEAIAAWQKTRNEKDLRATWRFTTSDARVKLKGLYPMADK